ncbi:choice-of-anchor Q domain-containing protein [Parabacteroides sp. PF5-6]|uniref:choice-of-anchor Q domain-containing protein n=1 Tax=Parabacteroides sp. PF5-6 TaxID=1742403 RepID=UPI0024074E26|nr:choice-of-anchor Q domain-containing protein [Parabacteroides sp. PF5-6]MDF9830910.1 hypothetical protein [Parabacteroides sp. PF5-6]
MKQKLFTPHLILWIALLLLSLSGQAQNALYVNAKASPGGDGSSWNQALSSLSDALLFTHDDRDTPYTLHVAQGTYYPESYFGLEKYEDQDPDLSTIDYTFLILSDITILGGYKADGSGERDPAKYPTILSGDLDKSGGFSDGDACHVVLAVGTEETRIQPTLEGLTITGGYSPEGDEMVVKTDISPRHHISHGDGGGLYNYFADTHLRQVVVTANQANNYGGGIFNNFSATVFTSVQITANHAGWSGGAIAIDLGSAEITQAIITGNQAGHFGGAISGFYRSSALLTQVTLVGNQAGDGGGVFYSQLLSYYKLYNSVVWGNTANDEIDNYDSDDSDDTFPTHTYCLVQGEGPEGEGNLDGTTITDPGFVNLIVSATTGWTPTAGGDYRLTNDSPLIDAGSNDLYPGADEGFDLNTDLDLAGKPRLNGETVDIGAYEWYFLEDDPSEDDPETIYHPFTLTLAPGIDLAPGLTVGTHQVAEGDHLFLQFLPQDPTLTADDVLLLIDGVDTPFNVPSGNTYYSYILPITAEHTAVIAQRKYPVTLTPTEGITYTPDAGVHLVDYAAPFSFTVTGTFDPEKLRIYVSSTNISQGEALRSETLPISSISYTIDAVTGPVTVTLDGYTTSNASLTHGIRVVVESGKLKVENGTADAVDVVIHNVTGQTVVQLPELRGSKTLTLRPGIYLVKVADTVYKVSVH